MADTLTGLKPFKEFSRYLQNRTRDRYIQAHGRAASALVLGKPYQGTEYLLHGQDAKGNLILSKSGRGGPRFFELTAGAIIDAGKVTVEKGLPPVELVTVSSIDFDPKLFVPMKSGTPIDYLFSADGGTFPGTNYVVYGDPGIGKSTVLMKYIRDLREKGKRVLRIECEMTRIDMAGYCARFPDFGLIPTLFMADYSDRDPRSVVDEVLSEGWDLVVIDSATEMADYITGAGLTGVEASQYIIDSMVNHNQANNRRKEYTSFIVVLQVGKGGNFVGSNKWKHNTTGTVQLSRSKDGNTYIGVHKNRRGNKYERLAFEVSGSSVTYRDDLAEAEISLRKQRNEGLKKAQELTQKFLEDFQSVEDMEVEEKETEDAE